jgi:hypothetical protein
MVIWLKHYLWRSLWWRQLPEGLEGLLTPEDEKFYRRFVHWVMVEF